MRLTAVLTTTMGFCAQLLNAAPTQHVNANNTTVPACHEERHNCRVIGPDHYQISLLYLDAASQSKWFIEFNCGPTEFWEVQTFEHPGIYTSRPCVPGIATFKLTNATALKDPKMCVGFALSTVFVRVDCVE